MALNAEEQSNYDALFGEGEDTVEKTAPEASEDAGSEESDEEENVSEDDKNADSEDNLDEDDSDESDDDEEEKPRKGNPEVPLKALRKDNERLIRENEGMVRENENYRRMLQNPEFLAQQLERVKNLKPKDTEQDGKRSEPAYIPEAPYYSNTPEGRTDMRLDIREAVTILPELRTDETLGDMVEALASNRNKPMSYIQAAKLVKRRMAQTSEEARKEGGKKREQEIADKERMGKQPVPGSGAISDRQSLEKKAQSSDKRERERAQAELLGII